jgi:hypothetical protein
MYYAHDTQITLLFFVRASKSFMFRIIRVSQLSAYFPNQEYTVLRKVMLFPDYLQISIYRATGSNVAENSTNILRRSAASGGRMASKPKFRLPSLSS